MPKNMSSLAHEVEVEMISPKQAAEYLDGTFKRNRPIMMEVARMYQQRIESGDFLTATPIVFASVANGEDDLVLVDGQHRLAGLSRGKKSLRFTVVTYYLNNDEELGTLYGTLDIGRGRNLNDNVRAHDLSGDTGLTLQDATRLASAVNYVVFKRPAFQIKARDCGTFKEQIDRAKDWTEEAIWYFGLLKESPKPMKNIAATKAIIACAMITLRGYPSKARDFWRGVLMLENLSVQDVRYKLHMKLVDVYSKGKKTQDRISPWGIASIIASCWNAYISNRQIQIIKGLSTIVFKRCKWREERKDSHFGGDRFSADFQNGE